MMAVVIHHNPDCETSRNVLAIIKASGYVPTVIEYLQTGWAKLQLLGLFAASGLTPRTALRESKSPARELGLLVEWRNLLHLQGGQSGHRQMAHPLQYETSTLGLTSTAHNYIKTIPSR